MPRWWSRFWTWLAAPPIELGAHVGVAPPASEPDASADADALASLPIDGELDLHAFRPQDVRRLVPDYIDACLEGGIHSLRIVHGKGRGTLRRTVHAALQRHPAVAHFALAPPERGGWGATLVDLHPPPPTPDDAAA